VPVLAGSAAYALGEARKWPVGLDRKPKKARAFYLTIAVATSVGTLIVFSPLDPITALVWSAVINGVVAVPIMVMMMLMISSKKIMGKFVITGPLKLVGWISTAAMGVAALVLALTSVESLL
jgi:Mn2+/Fe2+ NRAMP family transporter